MVEEPELPLTDLKTTSKTRRGGWRGGASLSHLGFVFALHPTLKIFNKIERSVRLTN